MSLLSITGVEVTKTLDNFLAPFSFKISFNCMEALPGDLEWNLIYVGSPESSEYDQVIDTVTVGPIPPGNHEFDFNTEAGVDPKRIQDGHLMGVTVIILNASYNDQEFVRVGYYINVGYDIPEWNENLPAQVDFDHLKREILASEPRVTRFKINWTDSGEKYSIADNAMERNGKTIGSGMSHEQLMMGADENCPPNLEMLKNAGNGQTFLGQDRMEALLSGYSENSNGPGGFGSSSSKAGYGTEPYETSMDGVNKFL